MKVWAMLKKDNGLPAIALGHHVLFVIREDMTKQIVGICIWNRY